VEAHPHEQDSTQWGVRRYYGHVGVRAAKAAWRLVFSLARGSLSVGIIAALVAAGIAWSFVPLVGVTNTLAAVLILFTVFFVFHVIRAPVAMRNEASVLAAQQVTNERVAGDQRVVEAVAEQQREMALRSMQHDTIMSNVTGDWSSKAAALEAEVASKVVAIASLRDQIESLTAERDQSRNLLKDIEEARPQLRLETTARRMTDLRGELTGYQLQLRVVNERPSSQVVGGYARIVEWGLFLGDEWLPDMVRDSSLAPAFRTALLHLAPGQAADFRTHTDFAVVDIERYDTWAHFAIDQPLRSDGAMLPGIYGVHIEVSAVNLGLEPIRRWFRMTLMGLHEFPTLEQWSGPESQRPVGDELVRVKPRRPRIS
jgi:hypothetical protein